MSELGFPSTELGSAGWLPEDVAELRTILSRHNLDLLASFIPLVMHDSQQADTMLAEAEAAADMLQAAGARYFNTAPVTSADWEPRRNYTDAEWNHLFAMMNRVEEICEAHDLHQVVHEHVGCVVETADDVSRLLDGCSVDFVLDTGHLAIGGVDPLEFANKHIDRTGLVHLKDVTLSVAEKLNAGDVTLMEAVQAGLFPSLGKGDLPLGDVIKSLESQSYSGWYVVEQDCAITGDMPELGDGPVRDVEDSIVYLQGLGVEP